MRICRFVTASHPAPRHGIVDGEIIVVLDSNPLHNLKPGKGRVPFVEATLLPPTEPSKVVCVGLNDRIHAREMGKPIPDEPRIFLKPSTAIIGPGAPIILPAASQRVEHEAELGIIIAKETCRVAPETVWDRILGYTCVNDVTARDIQRRDGFFTRAKGYDTFCPIGPWVETEIHPAPVEIRGLVNNELRQRGNSANMIRDIPTLIAHISSIMTLLPGDVVATGTYGGTGPLLVGDSVVISIEGVGDLQNPVQASAATA